jgi:hypothetical protein
MSNARGFVDPLDTMTPYDRFPIIVKFISCDRYRSAMLGSDNP